MSNDDRRAAYLGVHRISQDSRLPTHVADGSHTEGIMLHALHCLIPRLATRAISHMT